MKIFLSAFAVLILMLTIINGIRNRFRPGAKPKNAYLVAGIVICTLVIIVLCISAFYAGNTSHIPKMIVPAFVLVILGDQYRRNKRNFK